MCDSAREIRLCRMWLLVIAVLHWMCFFLMVHATTVRKPVKAPAAVSNFARSVEPFGSGSNPTTTFPGFAPRWRFAAAVYRTAITEKLDAGLSLQRIGKTWSRSTASAPATNQ
jgi:hypothetical protein